MAGGPEEWSIDELARRAGTTVRNVRLYQERGLLPPPRRDGRKGWYNDAHLTRLRLVLSMLRRGYPLTAIRELTDAWAARRTLGDVLGFEEALAEPFVTEEPRHLSPEELLELFPATELENLQRSVELGILVPDVDGFVAPSPAMLEVGAQLVADGVPLTAVLDAAAEIRAATDRLAERFVALFTDHVWQPFVDAGMPADDLPRITATLQGQRPLAAKVVTAALAQAMQRHTDEAAGRAAALLLDKAQAS
ncbi:MAG: MerR family transcriptional regulator [Actinomycetota bacterium]|nr:MerR family transcriptional regulator [Actinomycetota bacterium]